MAWVSSITRFRSLGSVFRASSEAALNSHLAKLSVLYEDLRIEALSLVAEALPDKIDTLGDRYRRNYFLRRSIATLVEFSGTLNELNRCADFKQIRARFDPQSAGAWDACIDFFSKNHDRLKRTRNDVGGHFGIAAAQYAVEHLRPDACGKLTITFHKSGRGGGCELHFAGELAATALCRSLPAGDTQSEIASLIKIVREGYHHATSAVHHTVALHLWPRFRN
jgi:hypothetical protein